MPLVAVLLMLDVVPTWQEVVIERKWPPGDVKSPRIVAPDRERCPIFKLYEKRLVPLV